MLRGVTENRTIWQTLLTQLSAQKSTTVMGVAPADIAVHRRVYHDLTSILLGIPVGVSGRGRKT